ncbi:XkdQ/YqbQ family protein [Paenibacillus elgii]|uniref:XkdQ/YqbQ family protein n=1 Tax=Paenibacillus elgii TaxID=189691 RepID=UPI000248CEEC|nr:hypothetical protein [Paenibacillus elgii]
MISVLYNNDIFLDPIVTAVTWSGDITQAARKLEVSMKNTLDGVKQAVSIELGRDLRLYEDGNELFRGIIFAHEIDAAGKMTVTAYDQAIYLTKNEDTRKFYGMTASAIIRELCADFGIEVGEIADTAYVIPRLILKDKSLRDMMVTALTLTQKQNGRRFWLTSRAGALNLVERGEKRVDWVLENGRNITGASYGLSIEDMRNKVKVVANEDAKPGASSSGGMNLPPEALDMISGNINVPKKDSKKPITITLEETELMQRFGTMQHLEKMSGDVTRAQVEQTARELLEKLSKIKDDARVEALGNTEITSGTAVYVIEPMTSIVGGFYVVTDSHTWEKGVHRMSLTISGDEGLPQLKYEEPPASKKKKKSDGGAGQYASALARLGE